MAFWKSERAQVGQELQAAADELSNAEDPQAVLRRHGVTDVPDERVDDFVTELQREANQHRRRR
jgi:hypothetical protein